MACQQAQANQHDIEAVAYSSQANSFLLLDERDRPLTPLILWPDRRAAQAGTDADTLWSLPDLLARTGLGLSGPEFAVAKLRWFQENEPQIW